MDDISQPQKERLAHIDFRLYFLGSVSRSDLVKRFGLKEAAATRDLAKYKEWSDRNLVYDARAKIYIASDLFMPLFSYEAGRVLAALSQGVGDDTVVAHKAFLACETPSQLNRPNLDILAHVTRAIHNRTPLLINYQSLSSGLTQRQIVPFCLVDNGLRWHVRAFDRRRKRFTDFVLTRITNPAKSRNQIIEDHEVPAADIQWNRIVELEIVPHPKIEHKETLEVDYGMINGVLRLNVRAAVAGYLLRRWNIDCTADGSLDGAEYHLWLGNRQALYGVENLVLAPGFNSHPL